MNTVDDVSRFSLVFTIHVSLRCESASKQLAQAVEKAAIGLDYSSFAKLKKASKNHDYRQAIRYAFYSKFVLEHFLQKSTIPSSINSIRAAFLDPVNILQLTFLHGTQMGTVIALARGDRTLKPGGLVIKSNEFCVHGEHNKGFAGVNRKRISGNILADAAYAINYALHNHSDFNKTVIEVTKNPERGACLLIHELEGFLKQFSDKTKLIFFWQNFLDHDAPPHRIFNFQRSFLIVKALNPSDFNSDVLPKLNELISFLEGLNEEKANQINEKLLKPILNVRLPNYSLEEIDLIKLDIPIIFGSKTVTVVNFKKKHNKNLAYPIPLSLCNEYVFKGTLKLNDHIQVVFTSREHIERVKGYLSAKDIVLPVLDMDACLLAASFIHYKHKKQKYAPHC